MLLIGKFACLLGCYLGGIVGGVFLHELGHALAALVATRQRLELEVGSAGGRWSFSLGRLWISARSRGLFYGVTRYDRGSVSRMRQTLVALGGPLASLAACLGFGWLTTQEVVGSWAWIVFLGLTVANFRILIVAVWPMEYRPNGPDGEVWLSDGLDVWRMWRGK